MLLMSIVRRKLERLPLVGKRLRRRSVLPTFGRDGWHPDLIARGVNTNSNAELLDYMDEADGAYEKYRKR